MAREEKIEKEGHHNQTITQDGAERITKKKTAATRKKAVVLQLDDRERAAMAYLGGIPGLKSLLCPEGLCIKCRHRPFKSGTYLNSLCGPCQAQHT